MDIALTLTASIVFAGFVWVIPGHFRSSSMPAPMRILSALGLITFAGFVVLIWQTTTPQWVRLTGLLLHLASGAVFIGAVNATRTERLPLAFSGQKPTRLVRSGPYRLVRHPFYLSYSLFWAGCASATLSPYLVGAMVVLVVFYLAAARGEEQALLNSPLAAEYRAYAAQTGRLLPRLQLTSQIDERA